MKVEVSYHACRRLAERFRLYFPNSCFRTTEDIRNLIRAQLKNARRLQEWKMVPFYANMIGWKHGADVEVYYRSPVFYFVRETDKGLFVMTVAKNFVK